MPRGTWQRQTLLPNNGFSYSRHRPPSTGLIMSACLAWLSSRLGLTICPCSLSLPCSFLSDAYSLSQSASFNLSLWICLTVCFCLSLCLHVYVCVFLSWFGTWGIRRKCDICNPFITKWDYLILLLFTHMFCQFIHLFVQLTFTEGLLGSRYLV